MFDCKIPTSKITTSREFNPTRGDELYLFLRSGQSKCTVEFRQSKGNVTEIMQKMGNLGLVTLAGLGNVNILKWFPSLANDRATLSSILKI